MLTNQSSHIAKTPSLKTATLCGLYLGDQDWTFANWSQLLARKASKVKRLEGLPTRPASASNATSLAVLLSALDERLTLQDFGPSYSFIVIDLPYDDFSRQTFEVLVQMHQRLQGLLESPAPDRSALFLASVPRCRLSAGPWLVSIGFDSVLDRNAPLEPVLERLHEVCPPQPSSVHPWVRSLRQVRC